MKKFRDIQKREVHEVGRGVHKVNAQGRGQGTQFLV